MVETDERTDVRPARGVSKPQRKPTVDGVVPEKDPIHVVFAYCHHCGWSKTVPATEHNDRAARKIADRLAYLHQARHVGG
jgi:hypothetical protein